MAKIRSKEISTLFTLLIASHVMLDAISLFVSNSGTAAYINSLLCTFLALAATLVINVCFDSECFSGVLKGALGRYVYYVFCFILLGLTCLNAAQRINGAVAPVCKYMLSDTPKIFVYLLFAVVIFAVTRAGIGVISDYAFAVGIAVVGIIALIIALSAGEADYINLCPILGKGDFSNVFAMLYVFSDIVYFYVLASRMRISLKANSLRIILLGGIITTVLVMFYTLCIPYPASLYPDYPLYTLASLANSSVVIQRLDGLVFIIWLFVGMICAGALTLFSVIIFKDLFGIRESKGICGAMSFVIFLISVLELSLSWLSGAMTIVTFVVLPVISLIYKLKKSWRNKSD